MTDDLTRPVDQVREQLKEAMRYVDSDPDTAREFIDKARQEFVRMPGPNHLAVRLVENLRIAVESVHVDPSVTRAYVRGAIHELGQLANDMRNNKRHES